MYVILNTSLWLNVSYLVIIAPTCFGLSCYPSSGSSWFPFGCAAYVSTYLVAVFIYMLKVRIKINP